MAVITGNEKWIHFLCLDEISSNKTRSFHWTDGPCFYQGTTPNFLSVGLVIFILLLQIQINICTTSLQLMKAMYLLIVYWNKIQELLNVNWKTMYLLIVYWKQIQELCNINCFFFSWVFKNLKKQKMLRTGFVKFIKCVLLMLFNPSLSFLRIFIMQWIILKDEPVSFLHRWNCGTAFCFLRIWW